MIKFEIIKDVEMNEENGGYVWLKVNVNGIEKFLEYSFDFGESLCFVEIIDENGNYLNESLNEVFGDEIEEELWNLDYYSEEV